jgi:lipoprotein-anchoring transpeptidase ErfK/SrfK
LVCTIAFNSCQSKVEEQLELAAKYADSAHIAKRLQAIARDSACVRIMRHAQDSVPKVLFSQVVISSRAKLDSIKTVFAKKPETILAYRAFTTVNRKNIQYFRLGDTLMLPSTISSDLRVYSLFPHRYPWADSLSKIIFISNKYQCYACYEHGKLVRFAACNTGRAMKPTFPGRYTLNWRDKLRRSSLDSNWLLPHTWNFHLFAGSAFHEFDMPGRPASHSCVRQFAEDAEWLYSWGRGGKIDTARRKVIPMTGTPVIILDMFDYSRKKGGPWWEIHSTKDVVIALPKDPMNVEEARIPISQIPPEVRWELPDKERYLSAEDTLRKRGWLSEEVELEESVNYNKVRREKSRAAAKLAIQKAKQVPKSIPNTLQ